RQVGAALGLGQGTQPLGVAEVNLRGRVLVALAQLLEQGTVRRLFIDDTRGAGLVGRRCAHGNSPLFQGVAFRGEAATVFGEMKPCRARPPPARRRIIQPTTSGTMLILEGGRKGLVSGKV